MCTFLFSAAHSQALPCLARRGQKYGGLGWGRGTRASRKGRYGMKCLVAEGGGGGGTKKGQCITC